MLFILIFCVSGKVPAVPRLNAIRFSLILACIVFFSAGSGCALFTRQLVFSDAVSGRVFAQWPVEEGTEFAIEFIHSVNKSPVREIFRVEGRRIRPAETLFSAFGAGMQSELQSGEELVLNGDGTMSITGFSQSFDELNYIVGTVSDHILYIHGQTISLRGLCGRNAQLRIRIKR
ncbi:DUF1850 domain-containing protein [Treponema sp. OttesenSCG-928-L16]|nr:DUF1850 domain-containing protein [Treponema sp. OttesenSCG-928-L16]